MAHDFILQRQLAFHETDMAGIAHFSNFFRWMEETEHEFLKSLHIAPVVQDGSSFWGWPRVRASCEYHIPIRFGETFEVHLFVKEIKTKSVVYFFRFRKLNESGEWEALAKGEITSVYAGFDVPTQSMKALDLERTLVSKLQVAPDALMKAARNSRPH